MCIRDRNLITHLLRICKGGEVADFLQRGIDTAQGYDGIGWRDAQGNLKNPEQALPVLNDLLERLQMWEANKE